LTFIKDVSGNADSGTASKWGGNDIMFLDKYFDNIDITPKVGKINTRTYVRSGKFEYRNPGDTFSYIVIGSALAANRNITLPLLTADDTFAFIGFSQTFTGNNTFTSYIDIDDISVPANPASTIRRLFVDTATGKLSVRTSGGTTVSLEEQGGSSSAGGSGGNVQYNDGSNGFAAEAAFTYDAANNQLTIPGATVGEDLALTGDISPSQITSNQNDYNPTNQSTSTRIRLDSDTSIRKLTGLANGADGRILLLENISANTIMITNQDTGSSTAGNRFDFNGYDVPIFPKQTIVLVYDSTLSRWTIQNLYAQIIPPSRYGFYYRHDMMGIGADSYVSSQVNGSGAANSATAITSEAGHPGVVQGQTGTTATGAAAMASTNQANILLGNNWYWRVETMIRIPTLSDGTNRFGFEFGFLDGYPTAAPTDGVYAFYRDDTNSGKWRLITNSNGTSTNSDDTGTAVAAATWYRLEVIVYGGEAWMKVNGTETSSARPTTNIPTGAGRGTGFGTEIFKSVGTTSRNLDVDYIECIGYANTVS